MGGPIMRIGNIQGVHRAYAAQMQQPTQAIKKEKKDELKLSTEAKAYQQAYQLAKKVPDVREDKVEALKQRLASGQYTIDATQISEKIISQIDMKG